MVKHGNHIIGYL